MIHSLVFTTQGRLQGREAPASAMTAALGDPNLFLWVDLENPSPEETKSILESVFHFHPLSIEDCVAESPTPKVEEYNPREDDQFAPYLFMVIHTVDYQRPEGKFATRELNFFLGKNFLVTYHAAGLRSITLTEESAVKGTMHPARGPDRLAHILLDLVVDNYNPVLDQVSEEITGLETMALEAPRADTLNKILRVKREVGRLRQIMNTQREVLARFARGEFKLVRPHLVPYYRDVYDSLVHFSELAQSHMDGLTGILQVYLNMSSNRTGEIVKLLTLITVITTPLMMIGTWYGMNFRDMPELSWKHGYPIAAGVMLASTVGTYFYFKRKKWL